MSSSNTEALEREVAADRAHLNEQLQAVVERAKSAAGWRSYARRQPLVLVGAAFLVGILAGVSTGGSRPSRMRLSRKGRAALRGYGSLVGSRVLTTAMAAMATRAADLVVESIRGAGDKRGRRRDRPTE